MSQESYNEGHQLDSMLREAELLVLQMRASYGGEIETLASEDATSRSVEEMLRETELLISQMDPRRDGSSLSNSQEQPLHPIVDQNLDDMLKRAEQLVSTMTLRSGESERTGADPDNVGHADLFASEMRSLENSVSESDGTDVGFSIDEMLLKAGILALNMKYSTSSSVSEHVTLETPNLLRPSDELLKSVNWQDESANDYLENTPELLRKTDQLLTQMSLYGIDDCSVESTDSPVDDMLRQTNFLIDQFQSISSHTQHCLSEVNADENTGSGVIGRNVSLRPPLAPRPPGSPTKQSFQQRVSAPVTPSPRQISNIPDTLIARAKKTEEMNRLIEQTLAALVCLDGQSDMAIALKGNVVLMENAISSLHNAPTSMKPRPPETHTPTSVSIQNTVDDELSSVGSGSARSLPLLMRSSSINLVSPVNRDVSGTPKSVDAAVEFSKQMAAALEETYSQSSKQLEETYDAPTGLPKINVLLDKEAIRKLEEQRRWEKTSSITTQEDFVLVADLTKRDGVTSSIRFEKVSNAEVGDEDYVPLVDYSKMKKMKNTKRIVGLKQPPFVRSHRRAKVQQTKDRRRKISLIVPSIFLLIFARFAWPWIQKLTRKEGGVIESIDEQTVVVVPVEGDSLDRVENRVIIVNDEQEQMKESVELVVMDDRFSAELDVERDHEDFSMIIQCDNVGSLDSKHDLWDIEESRFDEHEPEAHEFCEDDGKFSISSGDSGVETVNDSEDEDEDDWSMQFREGGDEDDLGQESDSIDDAFVENGLIPGSFQEEESGSHLDTDTSFSDLSRIAYEANRYNNYDERTDVSFVLLGHVATLDLVPKQCLLPFSYLVSKDCRAIAATRPLIDIHSILDYMLQ